MRITLSLFGQNQPVTRYPTSLGICCFFEAVLAYLSRPLSGTLLYAHELEVRHHGVIVQ